MTDVRSFGLCACRFESAASGVRLQELALGTGSDAAAVGDLVILNYVLRRSNGYFIYSTVEGIGFQPKDVPAEPFTFTLVGYRFINVRCQRLVSLLSLLEDSLMLLMEGLWDCW